MKIQGAVDTVVEPETVRSRPIPAIPETKPKETERPVQPVTHSAAALTDYSRELEKIAEAIRTHIRESHTSVDITVDEELKQIVTRVLDKDSGEVIRQYPEDAALAVMKHLKELRGLLLDRKG